MTEAEVIRELASAYLRSLSLLRFDAMPAWRGEDRVSRVGTPRSRRRYRRRRRLIDIPGAKILAHSPTLNQPGEGG
jgi:hypothetical protein